MSEQSHAAENDVRRLVPGTRTSEYGVVLDDLGSVDVYPTFDAAREAFRRHGGLGLVEIETTVMAYELPTPERVTPPASTADEVRHG